MMLNISHIRLKTQGNQKSMIMCVYECVYVRMRICV